MASQISNKLLFLLLGAAAVGSQAMPLRDVLDSRADLSESAQFARESGVLQDIESDGYGSDITVLFPSNEAWHQVSQARKAYLRDPINREDLETLLLFSTTDAKILKSSTYQGMPPLVTLLGVEASVDPSLNEVCVLSMMTGENYDCARVVSWDIPMDGGVIHIIDKVLFPEELEDVLRDAESTEVTPWRRLQESSEGASEIEEKSPEAAEENPAEEPERARRLQEETSDETTVDTSADSSADSTQEDGEGLQDVSEEEAVPAELPEDAEEETRSSTSDVPNAGSSAERRLEPEVEAEAAEDVKVLESVSEEPKETEEERRLEPEQTETTSSSSSSSLSSASSLSSSSSSSEEAAENEEERSRRLR